MRYFNYTFFNCKSLQKVSSYFTKWPKTGNYTNMISGNLENWQPLRATLYLLSSSTDPAVSSAKPNEPNDFLYNWTITNTEVD